jgi:hypothetical protein
MSQDYFATVAPSSSGPARGAFAITASDETDLSIYTRGFHCNVGGAASLVFANEDEVTLELTAGNFYPYQIRRLNATGTDVGVEIVGVY